jgi:hypothetical protein
MPAIFHVERFVRRIRNAVGQLLLWITIKVLARGSLRRRLVLVYVTSVLPEPDDRTEFLVGRMLARQRDATATARHQLPKGKGAR